MTIAERIHEILAKSPTGLKARQIAKLINEDHHTVNRFLYANQSEYSVDSHYVWRAKQITKNPTNPPSPQKSIDAPVSFDRCCYAQNINAFLAETERNWLDCMQQNFTRIMPLPLGESQIRAWKDCFRVLKNELPAIAATRPEFDIVFEYCLPYESGRRPDVLLISRSR